MSSSERTRFWVLVVAVIAALIFATSPLPERPRTHRSVGADSVSSPEIAAGRRQIDAL